MTKVRFYLYASNPLESVCELVGNVYRGGHKAAIICPDAGVAQKLDQLLWIRENTSFIPHVMSTSPLAAETPVVIGLVGEKNWPHTDVLFNIADALPDGYERFRVVNEVVGKSETELAPARIRWKHYKQQQLTLTKFDAERRIAI